MRAFVALIVPLDAPSVLTNWKGPAAAAWELRPSAKPSDLPDEPDREVWLSKSSTSGEWDALVGTLVDLVRRVPNKNHIDLYCSQDTFCASINDYVSLWKAGGWKRPSRSRADWQEYASIVSEKDITIRANYVSRNAPEWKKDFELLRQIGHAKLAQHARALGSPWGGFDPVGD